jgi:hypothetical protein
MSWSAGSLLTPLGQAYAEASILARKEIIADNSLGFVGVQKCTFALLIVRCLNGFSISWRMYYTSPGGEIVTITQKGGANN